MMMKQQNQLGSSQTSVRTLQTAQWHRKAKVSSWGLHSRNRVLEILKDQIESCCTHKIPGFAALVKQHIRFGQ